MLFTAEISLQFICSVVMHVAVNVTVKCQTAMKSTVAVVKLRVLPVTQMPILVTQTTVSYILTIAPRFRILGLLTPTLLLVMPAWHPHFQHSTLVTHFQSVFHQPLILWHPPMRIHLGTTEIDLAFSLVIQLFQ
jgi:hypothetical protein